MGGFKFNPTFKVIRFKRREYTDWLRSEVQQQIRVAARAFLRAVIKRVPVDTGEARGTLLPLGRFLNVHVPIDPKRQQNNKDAGTGEIEHPLIFDFESTDKGEYFTAQLQLFHYWWNDFFTQNYVNPQIDPPWHSIDDGVDAFMEYIKTEGIRKLPQLKDFLFVSEVKVNGGLKFWLPERAI